jgi:hypothetical protein
MCCIDALHGFATLRVYLVLVEFVYRLYLPICVRDFLVFAGATCVCCLLFLDKGGGI